MKENLNLYYDEEGDFLEINIGKMTKGFFREIGDGIAERVDEKTGEITGISILSFKKRIKKEKGLNISLPFQIQLKKAQSLKHTFGSLKNWKIDTQKMKNETRKEWAK